MGRIVILGLALTAMGAAATFLYMKYADLREDAEAYRRMTARRLEGGDREPRGLLEAPADLAPTVEALTFEVERLAENQRRMTELLGERRQPDDLPSPRSPVPGHSPH